MRAESAKLTTIATSPDRISSISALARRLADSSREGFTSVACMLAELSIRKTKRLPVSRRPWKFGRSRATASRKSSINCSSNSRFRRSRCQMLLTCRSSIDLCHRNVLGTSSGRRLSFRKYSRMMAGGTAARTAHCHQLKVLENRDASQSVHAKSITARAPDCASSR